MNQTNLAGFKIDSNKISITARHEARCAVAYKVGHMTFPTMSPIQLLGLLRNLARHITNNQTHKREKMVADERMQ